MSFTADGETLATVSMAPDYMLTIWDWKTEQMGLHSKAFGQDVWNVKFSEDDPRRLTTSGIGHIRFWKMASTFTGLKLQGYIGKFGKIDLSDIEEFVELPDGKVVSGTENGSMLLWEGNFIKCRFVQVGGGDCHNGTITYLRFNREEKFIVSAGLDGYIRFWDFHSIDAAEVDADHSMDFELIPLAEFSISDNEQQNGSNSPVGIKQIVAEITNSSDGSAEPSKNSNSFILYDTCGRLQKITIALSFREKGASPITASAPTNGKVLHQFHSQEISGMDTCPNQHLVATASLDGQLKVISYVSKQEICFRQFAVPITSLKWLPLSLDNTGSSVVVGFADGIIRILSIVRKSGPKVKHALVMRLVFKPHNAAIINMAFSENGTYFSSSGKDGIIFFHATKSFTPDDYAGIVQWMPMRFINLQSYISPNSNLKNNSLLLCEKMSWSTDDRQMLISCNDQILREVVLIKMLEGRSSSSNEGGSPEEYSFEIKLPCSELMSSTTGGNNQASMKASPSSVAIGKADGNKENGNGEESSAPLESTKTKISNAPPEEELKSTWKVKSAIYTYSRGTPGTIVASGNVSLSNVATQSVVNSQNVCIELQMGNFSSKKIAVGLYSADGKDFMKHPLINSMSYSWSKRYLLLGLEDGNIVVKPSEYLDIYAKHSSHNGNIAGAISQVVCSFDDKFVLSAGKDGNLVIHRMRLDLWQQRSQKLYLDLDAGVYGEEITKLPIVQNPEPKYLSNYSTNEKNQDSTEEALFEMNKVRKPNLQDVGITEIQLTTPVDRESTIDLASNSYSIQDNRLKAEEDMKKVAAEDLKQRILASIRTLRKDYEKIVKENEQIPEKVRLTKDDMCVDHAFFEYLLKQGDLQIQEVHQECAYESEKSEKLLQKLKSRLLNGLLMEEMPLYAFDTLPSIKDWSSGNPDGYNNRSKERPSMVFSLRVNGLDATVQNIIQQVKQQVREEQIKESQQRAYELAQKKAMIAMDDLKMRKQKQDSSGNAANISATVGGDTKKNTSSSAQDNAESTESTAIQRRLQRKDRKDALAKHESQKPSENQDAEEDIQAIKFAEKTIGDYKLKCSDDYEVPEEQRINAMKKMRQMAMLEDSMMTIRLAFNEKFLFLRNLKKEIIYSIRRNNLRIREIDGELNQTQLSMNLWEPKLNPLEFPEDYDEVTIEELDSYIRDCQQSHKKWEQMTAPKHQIILGNKVSIVRNATASKTNRLFDIHRDQKDLSNIFDHQIHVSLETYLSSKEVMEQIPERTDFPKYYENSTDFLANKQLVLLTSLPIKLTSTGTAIPSSIRSTAALKDIHAFESTIPSFQFVKSLQSQQIHHQTSSSSTVIPNKRVSLEQQKLLFERLMIFQDMQKNITSFHEAIHSLRTHRHQVISDLKLAEFKLLILYQEYKLLQTFESKDLLLQQKQMKNKSDEKENFTLMLENKTKLDNKMEEVQQWNEKLVAIMNECKVLLPENHPYFEILMKIFKKKIKRNKGNLGDEDEEDEEEEEEDDDDEDEDDIEVEDICPPGCDTMLYEKILDLREKKLETEEVCSDIQKVIEELKRTVERLKQREKQINKETQQTEYEVQLFQLQKQMALNQLRVVVPLKLSQVFMFEASGCLTGPNAGNPLGAESVAGGSNNNTLGNSNSSTNIESDNRKDSLLNANLRSLISSIKLKTHTLFSTK